MQKQSLLGAFSSFALCSLLFSTTAPPGMAGGTQGPAPAPINLDLTSTDHNLSPGSLTQNGPVNITEGGSLRAITNASLLTPAERLAVYQVVSSSTQSIVLSSTGNATGGSFVMGPRFCQYVSGMVLPAGVTALRDFGTTSALNLAGNLVNGGNIFAYSTNSSVNVANIAAQNIVNQQTGIISSILPSALQAQLTSSISNLSLGLTAAQNLINSGIITSANNLALTAGSSIQNTTAAGASLAVLQATNAVNLICSQISNTGLIASLNSNINMSTAGIANLLVQNSGGRFSAPNGVINVRDSSFVSKVNTDILGGVLDTKQLNIFATGGDANIALDSLTGVLNLTACNAHTSVSSGNLTLGNLSLTGDPDFYNLGGDVTLLGTINTLGAPLAVVAGGSILTTSFSPVSITTGGGALTLVAGANFTCGGACGGQVPPSAPANDILTISSLKPSSGDIFLTQMTTLNTSSATGSGGDILMVAPGSVWLPNAGSASTTGRNVGNKSGDFTIIAGGSSQAIKAGTGYTILTCPSGVTGANAGNVSISNRHPVIVPSGTGNTNVVIVNGAIATGGPYNSGTFGANLALVPVGDVSLGNFLTFNSNGDGGSVSIDAPGGSVTANTISSAATGGSGGDVQINAGTSLLATGLINTSSSGAPLGHGGAVILNARGGSLTTNSIWASGEQSGSIILSSWGPMQTQNLLANGNTGSGGIVLATSNGYAMTIGSINAYSNFAGGAVVLTAGKLDVQSIDVSSPTGAGGNIVLSSISGNDLFVSGTSGTYSLNAYGLTQGGSISVTATDGRTSFFVGGNSTNGTKGDINADGPGGTINLSTCGPLVIRPGYAVSAIGGVVTSDHACCSGGGPVLTASVLVGEQDGIHRLNVVIPQGDSSGAPQGTALATDTAFTGPLVSFIDADAQLQPPLLADTSGNAFYGNPTGPLFSGQGGASLIGQDSAGLIGQDSAGLIGQDSAGLIGNSGSTLIGQDGAGLIGQDGAGLIGQDSAGLAGTGWGSSAAGLACPSCGAGMSPIAYTVPSSPATISLRKGAALYNPSKDMTVSTNHARIHIAKDALALLLETGTCMAVYNLHDTHEGSVVVISDDTLIPVAPGQMVTLSNRAGTFEDVCPGRGISYRNPHPLKTGKTSLTCFVSEFSISSALLNVPPLHLISHSSNPQHRKTTAIVLKDAAIIMHMHPGSEPYKLLR